MAIHSCRHNVQFSSLKVKRSKITLTILFLVSHTGFREPVLPCPVYNLVKSLIFFMHYSLVRKHTSW